jgi:hypothetical protein
MASVCRSKSPIAGDELEGAPMNPLDAIRFLVARQDVLDRTKAKANRAAALKDWGLNVKKQPLDEGGSLAADDAGFMTDYAGDMVSGTALFPIMNATDSLAAVAELIEWRPESNNAHVAALLTLCRTATESAATTIWLLSSAERAIRQGLSVRFTFSELNAQRRYHQSTRKWCSTLSLHAFRAWSISNS